MHGNYIGFPNSNTKIMLYFKVHYLFIMVLLLAMLLICNNLIKAI